MEARLGWNSWSDRPIESSLDCSEIQTNEILVDEALSVEDDADSFRLESHGLNDGEGDVFGFRSELRSSRLDEIVGDGGEVLSLGRIDRRRDQLRS